MIDTNRPSKFIFNHIRFFYFLYWKYLDREIKMKEPSLSKIREDHSSDPSRPVPQIIDDKTPLQFPFLIQPQTCRPMKIESFNP